MQLSLHLIRPLADNATPWLGLIVGMPITGLYFWANNQTLVQRVLSAKSIEEGRKGVIFTGFLTMLTLIIIAIPGVIARDLFPGLEKPDMVYPNMVLNLMPIGLLGVMLAALLSALTSTLSAILNSTSTLFTIDFYAQFNKKASSKRLVVIGKIASCVIIILAALWAPFIGHFGSLLKYYQDKCKCRVCRINNRFGSGNWSAVLQKYDIRQSSLPLYRANTVCTQSYCNVVNKYNRQTSGRE